MTFPSNVVALFPEREIPSKKATTQTDAIISGKSTQLLALIEAVDGERSIFRFAKPIESTEEVEGLIDDLKWGWVKDVTIRLENGTKINDEPEAAIWMDALVFSTEARQVVAELLLHAFKDTETPGTKHIATEGTNGEVYITRVAA